MRLQQSLAILVIAAALAPAAFGADWPTYRGDSSRSGIAAETLGGELAEQWVFDPLHAPEPAWPDPAHVDYWHKLFNLTPAVTYDRAFQPIAAEGMVFFGSSADGGVYALDASTGQIAWTYFTGGPVRLAPAYADGRLYFGSDDGRVYCLEAATGGEVWTWAPTAPLRVIPGNGSLISDRPVRSGVLVKDGTAYFCAGIFPAQTVYLCALDAETGAERWVVENDAISPQGYLLASDAYLFTPTGRTNPAVIDRKTGGVVGSMDGIGGAVGVRVDDVLLSGPGRGSDDAMVGADVATRESVVSFPGKGLVVDGEVAYLQSHDKVMALDREKYARAMKERGAAEAELKGLHEALKTAKEANDSEKTASLEAEIEALKSKLDTIPAGPEDCALWTADVACPYAMVKAGNTVFAGGEDVVVGLNAQDGTKIWEAEVPGRAYGLAVANGRLLVSTSTGTIHCFGKKATETRKVVQEAAPFDFGEMEGRARKTAADLLEAVGRKEGYAVVLTPQHLALPAALAEACEMDVAVVVPETEADQATKTFAACGLYGARVSVHAWDGTSSLPYTTGMANVVVACPGDSGASSVPAAEALRIARPLGGLVATHGVDAAGWFTSAQAEAAAIEIAGDPWLGWSRGPVENAGEWTQLYADAGHTACSHDGVTGPFAIQWFGQPGPRPMIDRHHRPMSALAKDGRLFVTGDEKVIVVDAYNGAHLWELDIPGSRRTGALKNAGHQLITADTFYVVTGNTCWAVDPATGERRKALEAPRLIDGAQEWGYLNLHGDLLLGSAQPEGANFSENSVMTCALLEGDYRPVIVSDALFAVDRKFGAPAWTHHRGAYMNTALALSGGRLCFLEARGQSALDNAEGRMRIDHFLEGETVLAAKDAATGETVWEREVHYGFEHILFVNATPEIVLVSGTYNREVDGEVQVFYHLYTYRANDGAPIWDKPFRATNIRGTDWTGPGGTHGENWQHPVILGDTIYARPYAFDLATGEQKDYMLYRGGHGCGGLTASAHYLYGRGDNPRAYPTDVEETSGIQLTRVSRPGCWLNIIPAGGLVLIPESSSGCTCAYPLQTSIALAPKAWASGAPAHAQQVAMR